MSAYFESGSAPLMVDHTPSGAAVTAGQMLAVGTQVRIAKTDIADGKLGAVCIAGGVFRVDKAIGVGEAIADGVPVYLDVGNQIGTDVVNTTRIGFSVAAAGDDDPYVYVALGT